MCILERKTYIHSDGEHTFEKVRLCRRAVGQRPCSRIERRNTEPIRVVEARPSTERTTSDGLLITEGYNGRQNRYRDVSIRSSNSSNLQRTQTMGDWSPESHPSSASSPSIVEVKPRAPSPPPAVPGFPFGERLRSPERPASPSSPTLTFPELPISPSELRRSILRDGTAVYERPPSLELPRAPNNERVRFAEPRRQQSASSMKAEVDDTEQPTLAQRRRKQGVTIDTSTRPSTPSPSRDAGSPRLRKPLRRASLREAAGAESSRHGSKKSTRPREDHENERSPMPAPPRHDTNEDERLARLERERLAETDRRQPLRDQLARDASRERHRGEAAATLEQPREDPIQANIDADLAQMDREREAADRRRRESDASRRFAEDYVVRDAEGHVRYVTERNSPTSHRRQIRRSTTDDGQRFSNPPSPRATREPRFQPPVALHQELPPLRRDPIRDRGDEVIAREQARAATERLGDALGGLDLNDRRQRAEDRDYDVVDDYDIVIDADGRRYRRYRRRRPRAQRRERPAQEFYD